MSERKSEGGRPGPDRRPRDPEELMAVPDFAEEHTPSETDPSQAHESPVGGQDEGYEPPTRA